MTLEAGSRLAQYEISAPLGEGGMGVVYRASDTKLGREVAIKVLPAEVTADLERRQRFRQEAQPSFMTLGVVHAWVPRSQLHNC